MLEPVFIQQDLTSRSPHVVSRLSQIVFLVVLLLILAGWGRLLRFSFYAGPLLVAFGLLFLLAMAALREPQLLYPVVTLCVCGYYLILSAVGIPSPFFPILFLVPLTAIWLSASLVVKNQRSRSVLLSAGYLASCFFLGILVVLAARRMLTHPLMIAIPLVGISAFFIERYIYGRRAVPGYFGFMLFFTGCVFLILSIPGLPFGFVSLPLLALVAVIMAVGTKAQDRIGFARLAPVYVTGLLSSVGALGLSAAWQPSFLLAALGFSFHLSGFSKTLALKDTASRLWETLTYKSSFALANAAGVAVAIVVIVSQRPHVPIAIAVSAGYAYFYAVLGLRRKRTFLKTRSLYVYCAGFFSLYVYYRALSQYLPQDWRGILGILGIPILVLGLVIARLNSDRRPVEAKSILDLGYPIVCISFLLPIFLGFGISIMSLPLSAAFIATYLAFWVFTREEDLLLQLIPVGLFLLMSLAFLLGLKGYWAALVFAAPGIAGLVLGLVSVSAEMFARRFYYASFFLASAFSIVLLAVNAAWLNLYPAAVWAISYLVAGSVLYRRLGYA